MIPEEMVGFGPPGGPALSGALAVPPGAVRGVVVCHPHPLHAAIATWARQVARGPE